MGSPLPAGPADLVPVGSTTLLGTVTEFDEPRGLGVVRCGSRTVAFHCTAISDGTRDIAVGTAVAVRIGAGRLGRLEARSVHPLPATPDPVVASDAVGDRVVDAATSEPVAVELPVAVEQPVDYGLPETVGPAPVSVAPAPASPFGPIGSTGSTPVTSSEPPSARSGSASGVESEAASAAPSDGPIAGETSPPPVASTDTESGTEASPEPPVEAELPVESEPVESEPVTAAVPESVADAPPALPSDIDEPLSGEPTPVSGTPPVRSGTGSGATRDDDDDDSSPHPNFWSPYSRSPAGPPPTWSTPVTPREPPTDPS